MKQIKKQPRLLLILGIMACFLTGCSLFSFDASGYIQACLDANTKREFAAYAEITDKSEEELKIQADQLMDQELAVLDAYQVSTEKKDQFRILFTDLYSKFKYEVGTAKKNEDGTYSVPVTTYKLMAYQDLMKEGETYITEYVEGMIEAGQTPSQQEIYDLVVDYIYDGLSKNLKEPQYAEGVTTTVIVGPLEKNSNVYGISQKDLQALLESMVDVENAN